MMQRHARGIRLPSTALSQVVLSRVVCGGRGFGLGEQEHLSFVSSIDSTTSWTPQAPRSLNV